MPQIEEEHILNLPTLIYHINLQLSYIICSQLLSLLSCFNLLPYFVISYKLFAFVASIIQVPCVLKFSSSLCFKIIKPLFHSQDFELQTTYKRLLNCIRIPIQLVSEFVHSQIVQLALHTLMLSRIHFGPSIQQKQIYNCKANNVDVAYN